MLHLFKILLVGLLCGLALGANQKQSPKPPAIRFDDSLLPPLKDVLTELNLQNNFMKLVRMGVTETRLLLRLTKMDFRIMQMEWDDFSDDHVKLLKQKIDQLIEIARLPDELPPDPNLAERNKQKYGRLYINNSVQSFDYAIASFGAPHPPIGVRKLFVLPSPYEFGCLDANETFSQTDKASGSYVVVKRGVCSFFQKSQFVKSYYTGTSGLIIVNNVDQVESPSSGYGIDRNISEQNVARFNKQASTEFVILSVSNSSWSKLERSVSANAFYGLETMVAAVPLKCGRAAAKTVKTANSKDTKVVQAAASGNCHALLEVEKALAVEVTCGNVQFTSSSGEKSPVFDFLAAYVGATLPDNISHGVVISTPLNGCTTVSEQDINTFKSIYNNKVIVLQRGGCQFAEKLMFAQSVGALYAIIIDNHDNNALQHIGVVDSSSSVIGIPSIMITRSAGQWLLDSAAATSVTGDASVFQSQLTLHRNAGSSETVAQHWLELAHFPWVTDYQSYLMQLEVLINKYKFMNEGSNSYSNIIVWLTNRKLTAIEKN